MKKIILLSTLALMTGMLTACSNDSDEENDFPGTIIEEVKCDSKTTAFFDEKVYAGSPHHILGEAGSHS